MRVRLAAIVAAGFIAVAGCSGDGGGSQADSDDVDGGDDEATSLVSKQAPCDLIARLASTADPLLEAGASDPEGFEDALETAVSDFVEILDALAETSPDDLADEVEELRGLTEQYRFREAAEARAPIDEYARRECELPGASA